MTGGQIIVLLLAMLLASFLILAAAMLAGEWISALWRRVKAKRHEARCKSCQYARRVTADYLTGSKADFEAWTKELA